MMADAHTVVHASAGLGLILLTGCMALIVYRMVRGPHKADRIIALDLLSVVVVAWVGLFAVYAREVIYLDVAIAFALVAFLGTVAFARYLERSAGGNHRDQASPSRRRRS